MHKVLLVFLFLLVSLGMKAQEQWIGRQFKSDIFVGHSNYKSKNKTIHLTQLDESDPWGYFVTFHENGTFEAYNQVSCGQDCRMKIKGTYTLKDGTIKISVNEKKFYDACVTKPRETRTFTYGTFEIIEEDGGYTLKQ